MGSAFRVKIVGFEKQIRGAGAQVTCFQSHRVFIYNPFAFLITNVTDRAQGHM